jgi:hypothetical protein
MAPDICGPPPGISAIAERDHDAALVDSIWFIMGFRPSERGVGSAARPAWLSQPSSATSPGTRRSGQAYKKPPRAGTAAAGSIGQLLLQSSAQRADGVAVKRRKPHRTPAGAGNLDVDLIDAAQRRH